MNPRIFVIVAMTAFAAILGAVAFGYVIPGIPSNGLSPSVGPAMPLEVQLEHILIDEVTPKAATIMIQFIVENPNSKSVILQFIKYELYEDGKRIHIGEIGNRPNAFVTESNYFTVLPDQRTVLYDTITIKNTGNTPELWDALTSGSPSWRVLAEAYFNLSSITSGGENIAEFEFVP